MEISSREQLSTDPAIVIRNTIEHVKKEMEGESSGHDWQHTYRVLQTAITIGKEENTNLFVVELASLLHDLDDYKLRSDAETDEPKRAIEWMQKQNISPEVMQHVCQIIKTMSFRGDTKLGMETKEGMVVQDSDRLDAMGAVGIARAFMFAGNKGLKMHDPEIKADQNLTPEQYKDFQRPAYTQINHFYEKLLLLKDLMNTDTGKKMAEKRHQYMEEFLNRFYKEWEGKL